MHLGGDEVDTACWTSSPTIAAWLMSCNLTADQGYMYFIQRAHNIARSLSRDVIG